ncbi:MAG: DUF3105 domain-containing protein [Candidatus Doudnabacteria bacterium]|nr:DUF3105 domain-containing protein [Candidatus Doudnabacteria bacterium]
MDEGSLSKGEQERQARLAAVRRAKLKKIVIWLTILVLLIGGSWWLVGYSRQAALEKPGEEIVDQGRAHIQPGEEHEQYNSNPPTSGSHYAQAADWGVYDQELPDEQLIHNLEHGGIWISYKDPSQTALVNALKEIVQDYPTKVILTPRPANDAAIAMAAWGRLLQLDAVDEKEIKAFIKAYMNRGPEFVP